MHGCVLESVDVTASRFLLDAPSVSSRGQQLTTSFPFHGETKIMKAAGKRTRNKKTAFFQREINTWANRHFLLRISRRERRGEFHISLQTELPGAH